jgi:hypothetical protein
MNGNGTYALLEWLDGDDSPVSGYESQKIREWATARAGEVEQAKLARNTAELQVVTLKGILGELGAAIPETPGVRLEALLTAARELAASARDPGWGVLPFEMVQKLGARLVDLADAVKAVDGERR